MRRAKRKALKPSEGAAAVVTGAGSGIGRSFAYEIVRRGGSVICADIHGQRAEQAAQTLSELGEGRVVAYRCDVGSEKQMTTLAEQAESLLERPITLIVNNAGVGVGGPIGEVPLKDWRWCLKVNLWGVIHGCHLFAPKLRALGYGGIVNVASAAGFGAAPEMSAYNVTKSAVLSLSETLAAELTGTGVHVSALCPTVVPTNILDKARLPENRSGFASAVMRKWAFATSDQVARQTLDALDRKRLYVVPQFDGRIMWRFKRYAPRLYARTLGEAYRLAAG